MGMSFEVAHLRKFEHILDESKFVDGRVFQVEKLDLIYQFKWTWSFTISWFVMKKKWHPSLHHVKGDCHLEINWYKIEAGIQGLQGMGLLSHGMCLLIVPPERNQRKFLLPRT